MNKIFFKLLTFIFTSVALILIGTSVSATDSSAIKPVASVSTRLFNPVFSNKIHFEPDMFYSNSSIAPLSAEENTATYTDNKNQLANTIRNSMENRETVFKVYYSSKTVLSNSDFDTLTEDLVELSFKETNIPTQGDYIRYSWYSCGCNASGIFLDNVYYYDITFNFSYFTTKEQEVELTNAINNLVQSFNFNETTTDKQKIDTIYSYITSNIDYDYDNLNRDDYYLHFSAYAALMHKKAVCEGYSVLFYRLAETCGVDSRVITGFSTTSPEPHAWNIVKLGYYYYYIDSTWDAGVTEYSFYLKGTNDFLEHTNDSKFDLSEFKAIYPIPSTRNLCRE